MRLEAWHKRYDSNFRHCDYIPWANYSCEPPDYEIIECYLLDATPDEIYDWAEKRVEQYNQGQKANWRELRALEHANPVHLVLAVIGAIALICGLWLHSWIWIVIGVVLNFFGHLYCWLIK